MRDILKATAKTGSGSLLSVALMAIASKIMAVIVGPNGVGIYSMLLQLNRTATQAGSLGGGAALVQGLASREGSDKQEYITTSFWMFLLGIGAVTSVLLLLADFIASFALGNADAASVGLVRWLAIPTSLAVLHTYVRGVLNGFRAIGRLAVVQTSIAVVNAALAYPVSMAVDSGYAIAFVFMMSASFAAGIIIGVYTIRKKGWAKGLPRRGLRPRIHRSSAKHFFSIASVTIITGFLATGSLLAVRSLIVSYYGMDSAGIFNAAWAIGMTYALLALTSFGTYYLPTLSQIVDEASRTRLMNQVLWIATFAIVPLSVVAIVFKPSIVGLLYSAEFMPALDVIRWMLPAVYIKAAGWVLAMPMLAYAHMRAYLLTESLWYIGFVALSIVSVTMFDSFEGIGFGFLLMYVLYFAYVLFYTTRQWAFRIERRLSVMCAFGVALVVAASLLTWNHQSTSLSDIAILAPPVVVFIYLLLGKRRRKEGLRRVKQLFGRGE